MINIHWCVSRFRGTRFVPLSRGNERSEKWSVSKTVETRQNEKTRLELITSS